MSDSPGLVDFAIGLVNFVLNLPDGQVKFFEEFKLQKNCEINSARQKVSGASSNDVWASKCYLQLARMASSKTAFLCSLRDNSGLRNELLISPPLNKPPVSIKPHLSNVFEINKPPGGLIEDLR